MRKTDNGWWQVRERGGDTVVFSDRDSDRAFSRARSAFPIPVQVSEMYDDAIARTER